MTGGSDIFASFSIPPEILWGVFGLLLVIAVIVSAVLLYHWSRYGQNLLSIGLVTIVYIVGIAVLIGLTALFLASYISSL